MDDASAGAGKSALLIRLGGLGDLLVALPSVAFVRRELPGWELTLVCRREYGELFRISGLADRILSIEDRSLLPLFESGEPRGRESRDALEAYDLVLGWMQKTGSFPGWEGKAQGGAVRRSFIVPGRSMTGTFSRHYFDRTYEFFRGEGTPAETLFAECARLPLSAALKKEAASGLGLFGQTSAAKPAVVHPGSGSVRKRWPLARFIELMRMLAGEGLAGVVVTGEADEDLAAQIGRESLPIGWDMASRPQLNRLAGLLGAADLYVGNDSGVTHLAAACGTRVVALFRRENLPLWAPFGRSLVLSGDAVEDIPLADVRDACRRIMTTG